MYPHMHLSQLSLSSDDDMPNASALSVERTTLPICFELHAICQNVDDLFSVNFAEGAINEISCCVRPWDADAKLASRNLQISWSSVTTVGQIALSQQFFALQPKFD